MEVKPSIVPKKWLYVSLRGNYRIISGCLFLFHPGILLALGKGWTFAGRAAFETSGRYGFTPVINKIVKKNKHSSYFVAVPLPFRFANNHTATFAIGFQFGIAF